MSLELYNKNKGNFVSFSRNLEADECPSKENLFGQPALLMNAMYYFFPRVIPLEYTCVLFFYLFTYIIHLVYFSLLSVFGKNMKYSKLWEMEDDYQLAMLLSSQLLLIYQPS